MSSEQSRFLHSLNNARAACWSPSFVQERPRIWRIIWRIAFVAIVAFAVIWLLLFVTKGRFLKSPVESIASSSMEREVRIGGDFQLYFAPFAIKFLAEDISIENAEFARADAPDFFAAQRINTRISPFSLILGDPHFYLLDMQDGRIDLRWNQERTRNSWTFSSDDDAQALSLPAIERARIAGTQIAYRDPAFALSADISVDTVKAKDNAVGEAIGFDGNGLFNQKPFTLSGSLLTPNAALAGNATQLEASMATQDGTRVAVTGTLPGATQIEGAQLDVTANGPNLARLFDFLRAATPDTRTYKLTSDLVYQDEEWRFTDLRGTIGESDLSGRLTASFPNQRLNIDADLLTKSADIVDIAPVFGYDPQVVENSGAVRQVNGAPRLFPDAPLRADAVKAFDARIGYRIDTIRNDIVPLSDIDFALSLDNGVLQIDPVSMNMGGGKLTATAKIDASTLPVTSNFDIRLAPARMGVLLAQFGVEDNGTTGTMAGRIQLRGIGDTLHDMLSTSRGRIALVMPQGSLVAGNAQLSELDIGTFVQNMFEDELDEPVAINCGLVAFTVRDGIGAADPILIDTQKNVILGRGGFSFKTERLDMAVRADGKDFSLFSGQSPIGLQGYFAAPGIDPISDELLARAGSAVGLAIIATPLASVISFVDIGDAKPADCGPVLQGASAKAQRTKDGQPRDDVGRGTTAKSEDGKQSDEERQKQRNKLLRDRD